MLKRCLFAVAVVACGGGAKKPTTMAPDTSTGVTAAPAPSECEKVASHVADVVMASKDAPTGATKDVVVDLVKSHCEQDQWSVDAKTCFSGITDANGGEVCAKQLTADQQTRLKNDADVKFGKRKKPAMEEMSDDDADDKATKEGGNGMKKPTPVMKPPPAPPKSAPPRGGKGPVKSNDPCEGGE